MRNKLRVHKILKMNPWAGLGSPLILYSVMCPRGDYLRVEKQSLAMEIRNVPVCVGKRNEFHYVLNTQLMDMCCPPDAKLPRITPDYTRLQPITPYF